MDGMSTGSARHPFKSIWALNMDCGCWKKISMFSVLFEVHPNRESWDDYALAHARVVLSKFATSTAHACRLASTANIRLRATKPGPVRCHA